MANGAGGYDFGIAVAPSRAAASGLSGATSFRGGVALGPAYGPGSVVNPPASLAQSLTGQGGITGTLIIVGAIALLWWLFRKLKG